MRTLMSLALLLAGCDAATTSPMSEQGTLRLCLGASDPSIDIDYQGDGQHSVFDVQGTIAAVDDDATASIVTCNDREPLWLQIDSEDTRWCVGVDARDADGLSQLEALDVSPGDSASLTFLVERGWAMDNALILRDDSGVVVAAEEGYAADLEAEDVDLDGLVIARGEPYGRGTASTCGRQRAVALEAGSTLIDVGTSAVIDTEAAPLEVHNLTNWVFADAPTCTDTWGPSAWLAAR